MLSFRTADLAVAPLILRIAKLADKPVATSRPHHHSLFDFHSRPGHREIVSHSCPAAPQNSAAPEGGASQHCCAVPQNRPAHNCPVDFYQPAKGSVLRIVVVRQRRPARKGGVSEHCFVVFQKCAAFTGIGSQDRLVFPRIAQRSKEAHPRIAVSFFTSSRLPWFPDLLSSHKDLFSELDSCL